MSLLQTLLGFVALNPTYILPVLLRNAKPNNGQFQNRVPRVSNSIRLAVFSGQRRRSCETTPKWHSFFDDQTGCFFSRRQRLYETTFQKLELILSWALHFVGWVEPTPGFVGFRCTQPNLHFAGAIAKCETQQRPISQPSPKLIYPDRRI